MSQRTAASGRSDPPEARLAPGAHTAASAGQSTAPRLWSRGYLPHIDKPGRVQFITFRLHDSVPAAQIQQWKKELNWRFALPASDPASVELRRRIEAYEDTGHGSCYLREARIAALVEGALRHFHGERYLLLEWCIMPNHVHVLIETLPDGERRLPAGSYALDKIVHSWKSFTASAANKLLKRTGPFWMREYFDRYIRDAEHYCEVANYIRNQGPSAVAQSR